MRLSAIAVVLFFSVLVVAPAADAITIGVTGAPGLNGTPGGPGQDGGDGGLGGDAIALADVAADAENEASALGGLGGSAGAGGDGDVALPDGGNGGTGGTGGQAVATGVTAAGDLATALATGGGGGFGGDAGLGSGAGVDGIPGDGGVGGASEATARLTSAGAALGEARATATGGLGGGGFFGSNGGDGGAAQAHVEGDGTADHFDLTATARGGRGGRAFLFSEGVAGDGGEATASGRGTLNAAGSLRLDVSAEGGDAGEGPGGSGGDATLGPIVATSNAGADLSLRGAATGGDGCCILSDAKGAGGSATVVDAISAGTSGVIGFFQAAQGGEGGQGGSATSELNLAVVEGDFDGGVSAIAGRSFAEETDGAAATAILRLETEAGFAEFDGRAIGGYGTRDGGTATVVAEGTTHGDGNEVTIGRPTTTGFLFGAIGGFGRQRAGDASNTARGTAHGDSQVTVLAEAWGGEGVDVSGSDTSGRAGDGGDAHAVAEGRNEGASAVRVEALATGGIGGSSRSTFPNSEPRSGGVGGATHAEAHGASGGGGNVTVLATEVGGDGGGVRVDASGIQDGREAEMTDGVSGETSGLLRLEQTATGGQGGTGAFGGRGGDARSTLTDARNTGGGDLEVLAFANGGAGGASSGLAGVGGDAIVDVTASGSANVEAFGRAFGGEGGTGAPAGDATARVHASTTGLGSTADATARAVRTMGPGGPTRAIASATAVDVARALASADSAAASAAGRDGSVQVFVPAVSESGVGLSLSANGQGNEAVHVAASGAGTGKALEATPGAEGALRARVLRDDAIRVFADFFFAPGLAEGSSATLGAGLSLSLGDEPQGSDVTAIFSNLVLVGAFDELVVRLRLDGHTEIFEVFEDAASAMAYLASPIAFAIPEFEWFLTLELRGAQAGSRFGVSVLVVPEPSALTLVLAIWLVAAFRCRAQGRAAALTG